MPWQYAPASSTTAVPSLWPAARTHGSERVRWNNLVLATASGLPDKCDSTAQPSRRMGLTAGAGRCHLGSAAILRVVRARSGATIASPFHAESGVDQRSTASPEGGEDEGRGVGLMVRRFWQLCESLTTGQRSWGRRRCTGYHRVWGTAALASTRRCDCTTMTSKT